MLLTIAAQKTGLKCKKNKHFVARLTIKGDKRKILFMQNCALENNSFTVHGQVETATDNQLRPRMNSVLYKGLLNFAVSDAEAHSPPTLRFSRTQLEVVRNVSQLIYLSLHLLT